MREFPIMTLATALKSSGIYRLECARRYLRIVALNSVLQAPPPRPGTGVLKVGLLKRGGIGDWIIFASALERLWQGLGGPQAAELVIYTEARNREIIEAIGLHGRIVVFDQREARRSVRARHRLLSAVRAESFDLWLDADISRTNLGDAMALASAAAWRVGHAADAHSPCHAMIERRAFNRLVADRVGQLHMVERFENLVGQALQCLDRTGASPAPPVSSALRGLRWRPGGDALLIAPAASSPIRMWPLARFAELARGLALRHGLRPVVVGAAGDQAACAELCRLIGEDLRPENRAGQDGLAQLFERIASARLLLCSDSAPMHIGRWTATPTVAMVSGADYTSYAGYAPDARFAAAHAADTSGFDCRWNCVHPVAQRDANRKCLDEVGVAQAAELAERVLRAGAPAELSASSGAPAPRGPGPTPRDRAAENPR
jgi:ADP-heptose:LPS heptosyltransferase